MKQEHKTTITNLLQDLIEHAAREGCVDQSFLNIWIWDFNLVMEEYIQYRIAKANTVIAEHKRLQNDEQQPAEPSRNAEEPMRKLAHDFANSAYGIGHDEGYKVGFSAAGASAATLEHAGCAHCGAIREELRQRVVCLTTELDVLKNDFDNLRERHTNMRAETPDNPCSAGSKQRQQGNSQGNRRSGLR